MAGTDVLSAPAVSSAPPDSATVRLAMRLGWYLAELRGRYWWQGPRPRVGELPVDPPHALPLRNERTAAESRAQCCETVAALAAHLGVDRPYDAGGLHDPRPFAERMAAVLAPLEADGAALLAAPGERPQSVDDTKKDAAWEHVAALLHEWDAAIQDGFAAQADVLCNAYLLGRGLAESYWALGPERPAPGSAQAGRSAASAWEFLFGADRRGELSRLVGRVAAHVDPLTPAAIAGSIEVWAEVAHDEPWRAGQGRDRLYEQLRRWYELLVLGRDPTTFVAPYAVLHGWRSSRHAFRALWPQLALAAASAGAVSALAWFLTTDRGMAWLNVVLGLAGAVGLTAATVIAKVKNTGQRLVARLRQDAYSDLVAVAITCIPDRPSGNRAETERRKRTAVARRGLTPSTPLLDVSAPPS
jgi:hypothetical protein